MNSNHVMLAAIVPGNQSFAIVVRVIRTWHVQDLNKGKTPYTKEMVLMDATVSIQITKLLSLCILYNLLILSTKTNSVYHSGVVFRPQSDESCSTSLIVFYKKVPFTG